MQSNLDKMIYVIMLLVLPLKYNCDNSSCKVLTTELLILNHISISRGSKAVFAPCAVNPDLSRIGCSELCARYSTHIRIAAVGVCCSAKRRLSTLSSVEEDTRAAAGSLYVLYAFLSIQNEDDDNEIVRPEGIGQSERFRLSWVMVVTDWYQGPFALALKKSLK